MRKKRFLTAAAGGLFLLLVWKAGAAREGAAQGLRLLGELLIPSLLPLFTAAGLLARLGFTRQAGRMLSPLLGRALGLSPAGCGVFLIGLSGGYPLGAVSLAEHYSAGQLSREEALRLLRFCDNTGPAFAVGALGAALRSPGAGLFLWGIHVLSALLTGLLLRGRRFAEAPASSAEEQDTPELPQALSASLTAALEAMLKISVFVLFFSAVFSVFGALGLTALPVRLLSRIPGLGEGRAYALVSGFLELGTGAGALQGLAADPVSLAVGGFILSFGGLCVHAQSLTVLRASGLSGKGRLGGKLLQGLLSALLTLLFAPLIF